MGKKNGAARPQEDDTLSADITNAVNVDTDQIDAGFSRLPGDIAYRGVKYAKALRKYLLAKHDRDVTWSRLYLLVREKHDRLRRKTLEEDRRAKVEKLTEAQVDALIEQDEEYQEAKIACIEAEVDQEVCRSVVDALRAKKDALVSIGANQRAERDISRGGRDFKAAIDVERSRTPEDD